jgi:hypothetical protein
LAGLAATDCLALVVDAAGAAWVAGVEPAVSDDCAAKAEPAISVVASRAAAKFLNMDVSCLFHGGDFEIDAVVRRYNYYPGAERALKSCSGNRSPT